MSKPHIGMEEGGTCALLDRYDTEMLEVLSVVVICLIFARGLHKKHPGV